VNLFNLTSYKMSLEVESDNTQSKPHLGVVIVGHVDAGKSTTTGHLLFKLGGLKPRVLTKLKEEAKRLGRSSFEYAFFLDKQKEERERGITITSLSSQILETKKQIFQFLEENYGWEFKIINEDQIQLFKGFDFLYQFYSKENVEVIHCIQHGFSFTLPINNNEIDIVMKAFSIKHK